MRRRSQNRLLLCDAIYFQFVYVLVYCWYGVCLIVITILGARILYLEYFILSKTMLSFLL
jgi:hypothetical protein